MRVSNLLKTHAGLPTANVLSHVKYDAPLCGGLPREGVQGVVMQNSE